MDKMKIVEQFTRTNEALGIDAASELFSDDIRVYANVFDAPKDKAGELEFSRSLRAQCAVLHMDILSLTEEEGGVRRVMRAHGVLHSGRPFDAHTNVWFGFDDKGKICEIREHMELDALAAGAKGTKAS